MINKIAMLVGGLGLVGIGAEIFFTGHLEIKGYRENFFGFNVPIGIVLTVIGLTYVTYAVYILIKKRRK